MVPRPAKNAASAKNSDDASDADASDADASDADASDADASDADASDADASDADASDASADERPEPDAAHRGTHWREDKIALAMTMRSDVRERDPCPTLPTAFADPTRIAKLTRELKTKRSANA